MHSIGLDYGTLSVRAVILNNDTGKLCGSCVYNYPHGVITQNLNGKAIPQDYALADPQDYLDGLSAVIKGALKDAHIDPSQINGIGLDVTSSSVLPLDKNWNPLCFKNEYKTNPHAYIKLWKHHGAKDWAHKLEEAGKKTSWMKWYGSKVNCELLMPKALELQNADSDIWNNTHVFCEVADWLCHYLTGTEYGNLMMAQCNAFYYNGSYPSDEFFNEITPGKEPVSRKLITPKYRIGEIAGKLTEEAAKILGLVPGIPVATPIIDSHASVLGCGAVEDGDLVSVIGTSACHLYNSSKLKCIEGIYSAVWEAHSPGLYGFEGGQTCAGDAFEWVTKLTGQTHSQLMDKCKDYLPGQSGLVCTDWLAGVRTPEMQPNLRGRASGLSLLTKPEDLYHAMMEAVCFGTARIVRLFQDNGLAVKRLFAAGGIPAKNPQMMQMLSDITGLTVIVCNEQQTSAHGAAVAGVAAANGGNSVLKDIGLKLAPEKLAVYEPDKDRNEQYGALYKKYLQLCKESV